MFAICGPVVGIKNLWLHYASPRSECLYWLGVKQDIAKKNIPVWIKGQMLGDFSKDEVD